MTQLVFDLDGVLVDSREANRLAYQSIGIQPPPNFHVRPWQQWVTQDLHDMKNLALVSFAAHIRPGPLWSLVKSDCMVLSNCSPAAFEVILTAMPTLRVIDVTLGLDVSAKVNWLNMRKAGIYFDDSAETCAFVRANTEWTVCRVM